MSEVMQSTPHPPVSIRPSSYSVFPTSIVHPTSHTTTALAYVSATPYKDAMVSPTGTIASGSGPRKYAFGNTLKRFACIAPVEDQYVRVDDDEPSEQVDPSNEVERSDSDTGYTRFSKFACSILRCPSLGWIAFRKRITGPASHNDGLPSINEPVPKLRISHPAPLSSRARIYRQPQAGPSTTTLHSSQHLRPSRIVATTASGHSSYSAAKRSSSPYGAGGPSSQTSSMSGGSAIWKVRPSPVLPGSRPGLPPPGAISGLPLPSSTYSSRPTSVSSRSRPHTPSDEEGTTTSMAIPHPRPERQMANFQFAFSLISLEEAREREDIVKRNIARD